jgi:hypothetical protein
MNTLIFIQTDVKSRRLGGATQPLDLRWGFETTSIRFSLITGLKSFIQDHSTVRLLQPEF